ncbi:uncharacterized protein [Neodiprion pinetum]|uniref:Uncharacterized protein LOC107217748 isoform X3 n=1 Tax=Neodiprion lecontei TaxID=441921 RepID=A0ABM3FYK7_NEOLC|nr:uncharacterized protein LOC124179968 isoform X3 [Neodiprion fabricii]XP_046477203.1 uncharacterized protein LOC124216587 isoform X3 [Neodiprion pinetum]XP_046593098.1 uncharacterized protein LOC107217748 isoform X3 [Neodiprion lecontei]XP_046614760.1 uncharacterized protein LOC124302534 isoform X3 [Neodiprion virginianus]
MSVILGALRLTCWLSCLVLLIVPTSPQPGDDDLRHSTDDAVYDEEPPLSPEDSDEDFIDANTTERGLYLGSPCDLTCNPELQHVFCDPITAHCECEKFFPVRLGPAKGCAKPKKLGEQCFYRATCTFADQYATCTQVQHNAICECKTGYHRVALSRPSKKVFCAEDLVLITTDVPTLLGVASGLAIFTALICFVLKLFSRARYTRPRHYANANHAPPMLFSSDTGIPLTLHGGRPSSRSSQRSGSALASAFSRRPSSGGSRGPLVPASRAGSRRPSLASIHSSTSSARSYSARRLERERNEKEHRLALQELRLQRQREQQQSAPTPSPRTPHSTDELLPSVDEVAEQVPTTSGTSGTTTTTPPLAKEANAISTYNGPCTSADSFQV